ncbi:MAG: rod-binding protein [Spirochaetia bacterium]|nr:rod-binding protein [Spirochaetia bacterium]
MNTNTIDPFLYNGAEALEGSKILDIKRQLEKKESEFSQNTTKFLEQLNTEIDKAMPDEAKYRVSSNVFNKNMNRKEILEATENSPEKRKLFEAAKEFESFFVEKMFVEMKKNVPKNPMFHGGYAEDMFDDMLMTERVRKMSQQTEFGLAEKMYQQLSIYYS